MNWLTDKLAGYKTHGTAWSAVLVVLVDLLGWYDVPGLDATPAMLGAAVVAALVLIPVREFGPATPLKLMYWK